MVEWYQNEIVKKIFDTTPDMLGVLDENGKILECNHHIEHNTGYIKKDLIGIIGPVELIDEKDRERAMRAFEKVKIDGINLNVPLAMRRKNGSVFPSLWSGSILRDQDNKIVGYLVTGKDLSEIYALKDKLLRSEERLNQEKLAVIGELTARIAHDLRNPLNVAKQAINLIKLKNPKMVESMSGEFEKLTRSVNRMAHQIDDVLDYVRPQTLSPRVDSLQKILKALIEKMVIPDGINITFPENDYQLFCDIEKIEIVFVNLITNSIQAMNGHGKISIIAYDNQEWTMIEVSDTGPGIPSDIVSKIFDPLFTTKQTGTGLGLVSCKRIIENHGGSLTLKKTEGGTTFLVQLHKTKCDN